jgi:nitrogen fixation/metabolism regulation signal transduction histidine kinase
VRRSSFRQQGIPHTLVVLSDVSRALREEERRAWQRLIRVLGHELNNSLAPIKSIAGSLHSRLVGSGIKETEQQDFERGLSIIEGRAASLNRFLQGYRQLAQMPPPALQSCSVRALANRVADLETRASVRVVAGPDATFTADPDQLEQMLINVLRNAAEAVLEMTNRSTGSNGSRGGEAEAPIVLSWTRNADELVITIEDSGPGLMNPSNVFVPFYTTKPTGSGIGLVLSRQIAEAHGGSLELQNRATERGCIVKIMLPVNSAVRHRSHHPLPDLSLERLPQENEREEE